jgi:hypothetical protein
MSAAGQEETMRIPVQSLFGCIAGIGLVLSSASCALESSESSEGVEPIAEARQEVESSFDKPVAAATSVWKGTGAIEFWVFVRDASNSLMRRRFTTSASTAWENLSPGDIADAPALVRWSNAGDDSLAVYVRATDNHLWELWYPSVSGGAGWANVTASIGFGTMVGTPIADEPFDTTLHELGVLVRKPNNQLWSIDWDASGWLARSVRTTNNLVVTTTNTVSRDLYLAGRGLGGDDTAGWIASRPNFQNRFVIASSSGSFAIDGTPTTAEYLSGVTTHFRIYARFGSTLKFRDATNASGSWTTACSNVSGSPERGSGALYIRGTSGDLKEVGLNGGCVSRGGTVKSKPTSASSRASDGSWYNRVLYKGSNNNLWQYSSATLTHTDLGVALP